MKISFVGLGIMGSRMATHLIKAGFDLTVFNRSAGPGEQLKKNGAKQASSIKEALVDADLVISMLSNPEAVEEVMLEKGLSSMKKNALWVDCSTVNPSFAVHAAKAAKANGIRYLEAPVAGSKPQVEAAELVIFAGGDANDLKEASPVLESFSRKILHLGQVGKGASMKLVVNMQLSLSMLGFVESMKFGESMGLEKDFLLDVLPTLPVSAPFTQAKAGIIRDEIYEPEFPLELLHKDLHLAAITAYEENQELPFANAAKELYATAKANGMGREDMAAIYKLYNRK